MGIQFNPLANFLPIQAYEVWSLYRDGFPRVEELPALPPQFETFGVPSGGPGFAFGLGRSPSRYWFSTQSGDQLIQFQPDRLLHNWRKTGEGSNYPRFETILPRFQDEVIRFEQYAKDLGNDRLFVNQAEISYINQIPVGSFEDPLELQRWLSFLTDAGVELDEFHSATRYIIRNSDGSPYARMHRETATGTDPSGRKVLTLNFTVRGVPQGDSVDSALEFIAKGRHMISEHFLRATTKEAQIIWKRVR